MEDQYECLTQSVVNELLSKEEGIGLSCRPPELGQLLLPHAEMVSACNGSGAVLGGCPATRRKLVFAGEMAKL